MKVVPAQARKLTIAPGRCGPKAPIALVLTLCGVVLLVANQEPLIAVLVKNRFDAKQEPVVNIGAAQSDLSLFDGAYWWHLQVQA